MKRQPLFTLSTCDRPKRQCLGGVTARLVGSSAISRQSMTMPSLKLSLANASIAQAEAALENANIRLGYTDVVSPISGIIGRLVTEVPGERSQWHTLALVQQLDTVYVDFNQTVSELSGCVAPSAQATLRP